MNGSRRSVGEPTNLFLLLVLLENLLLYLLLHLWLLVLETAEKLGEEGGTLGPLLLLRGSLSLKRK